MNYYELFNIPFSPKVDPENLQKKYYELQRSSHPDFHSGASEEDQQDLLELSAHINKAIAVFKDEQKTIAYFLELKGVLETDEKYVLPNDFLMEMMEINEDLETMDPVELSSKIESIEQGLFDEISDILTIEKIEYSEKELHQLKEYYYKKKYLHRILERLHE